MSVTTKVRPGLPDRLAARRAGLPRPQGWRQETVRIPARDGVELGADLYTPLTESKGVLLTRGPYGRGRMFSLFAARVYAGQGYTVLFASTRGTADSGGAFDPMRDEASDGQDVVAWMRRQPWYPGRFATIGGSYLGHTQWALLDDPPADLAACVVAMGPHDFSRHSWGTGTFNMDILGWSQLQRIIAQGTLLRGISGRRATERRLEALYRAVPLADGAQQALGADAPWLHERLVRPDLADPFWAPMQHAAALEKAAVPILIQAGWQDIFLAQSMEQYARLRARGVEVALTVGAWTHMDLALKAGSVLTPELLAWVDHYLGGKEGSPRPAPVRIEVGAGGQWQDLAHWPPPSAETTLYLHGDGQLTAAEPPAADGQRSFTYDPGDPTPALGGNMLGGGGYQDDRELAGRPDVLSYETGPLPVALTLMGSAAVTLAHAMEQPDGDLFIRISDVDARGRSRNVAEVYRRVGEQSPVTLDLLPAAHVFPAGHRIRLLLAGGSFPQFAKNPGTGENPLTAAKFTANQHTIRHAGGASALRLPVIP